MKTTQGPHIINSITELHRAFGMPKPQHPLISFLHHADVKNIDQTQLKSVVINFYLISNKKDFKGKIKYGKNYYDFDEGTMTFLRDK